LLLRLPGQWNICVLQRLVENRRRGVGDKKALFLLTRDVHYCSKTLKADDEVRRHPIVGDADAMSWIETLHALAFVLLNLSFTKTRSTSPFNHFLSPPAAHTDDAVRRLRRSRSLIHTPAAAWLSAPAHPCKTINAFWNDGTTTRHKTPSTE